MAETKKNTKKTTTKKTVTKKATPKKTPSKSRVKKEETVFLSEKDKKEIFNNVALREENEDLRNDIRRYKVLMILLIILVFVSVISQGLKYYSEYYKQHLDSKISVIHSEPLDVNSKEVKNLYNKVNMFKYASAGNYMGYFYEKRGTTLKAISDDVKIYMGLSLVDTTKKTHYGKLVIPRKEVKEKVESIFGENVKYEDRSLGSNNLCYISLASYNNVNESYEVSNYGKCKDNYEAYYGTKVISADKFSNRIELYEKAYYGEYEKDAEGLILNVYKDQTKEELITSLKAIDLDQQAIIDDFYKDLNTYKYTFYLEKDKYYLNSVERVN